MPAELVAGGGLPGISSGVPSEFDMEFKTGSVHAFQIEMGRGKTATAVRRVSVVPADEISWHQ